MTDTSNNEDNTTASLVGEQAKSMAQVKANIKLDQQAVSAFDKSMGGLKKTLDGVAKTFKEIVTLSGLVKTPGGGSGQAAQNGTPGFVNTSHPMGYGRKGPGVGDGPGGPGQGSGVGTLGQRWDNTSKGTKQALAVAAGGAYASAKGIGAIDARVDENRQYSLPADRINMVYQLRSGLSQLDAQAKFRQPYNQYKLGNNGINEMNQFELRNGQRASGQGVEAIRAATGYSMGTEDVLSMFQQNLDPSTANQQFMHMGGLSAIGPGGKMRDQNALMDQRVKLFGLDKKHISDGAMMPGSITRAAMTRAGISQQEQEILLEKGLQQQTFAQKGGQGTLDLTNKEHRKTMGVDENFAKEAEESDRKRTERNEDMYREQNDNYADLEKSNQALIGALNSLEDMFGGVIGHRTSTRPFQNMVMGAVTGGLGAIPGVGMLMNMGGDPNVDGKGGNAPAAPAGVSSNSSAARDDQIKIPYGYGGKKKSLTDVKSTSDFQKVHPKMQQRLLAMFRENPNVGIGGTYRSPEAQEKMFRERYEPTSGEGISWNGQNWKRVRGAQAAPPGRSYHEIGLAADLVGDLDWMNANAARFGLRHFNDPRNKEPWHVQPAELPGSRREYEANGAPWGTNGDFSEDDVVSMAGTEDELGTEESDSGGHGFGGGAGGDFTGMSLQNIVDAYVGGGIGGMVASVFGGGGGGGGGSSDGDATAISGAADFNGPAGTGAMAAAKAAFAAGFRGGDLTKIVAIGGRESNWSNIKAKTSDDWGVWQINGINMDFLRGHGIVDEKEQLLNPTINARAAFALYKNSGFSPWNASGSSSTHGGGPGFDGNGDHMWNTSAHQAEAATAASAVTSNGGDPNIDVHASSPAIAKGPKAVRSAPAITSGGATSLNSTYQIDFNPTINISGAGGGQQDLNALAGKVESMLKETMNRTLERSA